MTSRKKRCECAYCQLLAYGWKEEELKGHAKDCPLFDHPLGDEVTDSSQK
jgi:hypothetical protein